MVVLFGTLRPLKRCNFLAISVRNPKIILIKCQRTSRLRINRNYIELSNKCRTIRFIKSNLYLLAKCRFSILEPKRLDILMRQNNLARLNLVIIRQLTRAKLDRRAVILHRNYSLILVTTISRHRQHSNAMYWQGFFYSSNFSNLLTIC